MSSGYGSKSGTPKKQATLSSFFTQQPSQGASSHGKRPHSPIDLTSEPEEESRARPLKKYKSYNETSTKGTRSSGHTASQLDGGHVEQWRFNPAVSSQSQSHHSATTERENHRLHEKAKKILLSDSSVFSRPRRSDDIEPTEHNVEARASGDASDDAPDSGAESDRIAQLMKTFTNPKGVKGKAKAASKQKSIAEVGPSGQKYTPLELQVREFKEKYPGTLLMFEVGYKSIFYGEDAKIAAKELGIVCFQKRNFMTSMIPLHRRDIHLKKLLSKGYKVGIVEQTETAALKKISDNRNDVFSRKLTHLYTSATYIEELNSVDDLGPTSAPPLMCLVEEPKGGMGLDERVVVGMIVISPSTGDVVWDEFEDNHMRTELETRTVHTKPYELLLPEDKLTRPSEKMITHLAEDASSDYKIRIERFKKKMDHTSAFSVLTKFYNDATESATASEGFNSGKLMAAVADFPKLVVLALAHVIRYLSDFEIEDALKETQFFSRFTERTHMLLNGNTLTNLEIYRNETDFTAKGSLMWILDHTTTKFGARMLRSWVGRPLVDLRVLRERIDAVEEILLDMTPKLTTLRDLLRRLPDLARGLCRIQYGKCTPQELGTIFTAFNKIATAFNPIPENAAATFKSPILNSILVTLPKLREPMKTVLESISLKMAAEGKKESLWTDPDKYPALDAIVASIEVVETELADELKQIRKVLKKPALTYTTWMDEEYLVEVRKDENRDVPVQWTLVSSTRQLRRYHTPEVKKKLEQRAQYKESLAAEAQKAYRAFLEEITQKHYALFRDVVNKLAVADCLCSLARVALQEGYVKPEFTEDDVLEITDGRHPMIEALRSDPFVPNTVGMGGGGPRSKIITGPNMGGKSSAVRMIALCAIMAQIGSYVPAASMKIGLLDGILTRMGASDELARGRSTFMIEMQETSDILQTASQKTLVILDELGRGTSTFDGMAIASAVLQHLVQNTKCKTLFITHYPQVATDLVRRYPQDLENLHMGFTEETRIDGTREVTFLYRLTSGITAESFGVECARLAHVPEEILQTASERSQSMRSLIEKRVRRNKLLKCARLIRQCVGSQTNTGRMTLDELRDVLQSLE